MRKVKWPNGWPSSQRLLLVTQRVSFTEREKPATVGEIVPRRTLNERLRQRLHELLRDKRFSKGGLSAYCGQPPQWISGILHQGRGVRLDDLDGIAAYFRLSYDELIGGGKSRNGLTGDEHRLLLAFRELAPATREHFLALIEQASLAPRVSRSKRSGRAFTESTESVAAALPLPDLSGQNAAMIPEAEVPDHGGPLTPADIERFFRRLEALARSVEIVHRPDASARTA